MDQSESSSITPDIFEDVVKAKISAFGGRGSAGALF